MKYKRFVDAAGGWPVLQRLLAVAAEIARKHGVSVANVAGRWVLDHPAVAGVIVGARLGESEHRGDNLGLFRFALDAEDRERLAAAAGRATPGDCGDEYRRPPYLTASGDLSHHLDAIAPAYRAEAVPARPGRRRASTGSAWEAIAGYSRAVRSGDRVLVSGTVSGTTATRGRRRPTSWTRSPRA